MCNNDCIHIGHRAPMTLFMCLRERFSSGSDDFSWLSNHYVRWNNHCVSVLVVSASFVCNIKLLNVRIANHTVLGSNAKLECTYDLEGETLYSVKWYKDGDEFFRYLPKSVPEIQVFEQQGIYIDVSISVYFIYYVTYSILLFRNDMTFHRIPILKHSFIKCIFIFVKF